MATRTPIDLNAFCEKTENNYCKFCYTRPWVKAGWRYATDGKIVIRVRSNGSDSVKPKTRSFPPADQLFRKSFKSVKAMKPWPSGTSLFRHENSGILFRQIGQVKIGVTYDKLIAALPNAKHGRTAACKPLSFVFDGGEGLVMPLAF